MGPLRRRTLLGLAGAALSAGTAGCLAVGRSGTGTPTPTATETSDRGPGDLRFGQGFSENGVRAEPSRPTVQGSVLHETPAGALDVLADEGRQYLFLTVTTGGSPGIDLPGPRDFRVSLDGGTVRGRQSLGSVPSGRLRPDGRGAVYDIAEEREVTRIEGWLVFPLPTGRSFERATLGLRPSEPGRPAASWGLPRAVRSRLAAPPAAPRVESLSVPERATGGPVPVSVAAANDGGRDGTLRFGVNVDGSAARAGRVDVPAGATTGWEGSVEAPAGEVTVELRTAAGRLERTVTVDSGG